MNRRLQAVDTTPLRAVIYPRVSMDKSGEGASVARQEKACRALCEARGWQIVAVHPDTQSAWSETKERPGWAKVLQMVEAREVDVIVAWHLDRVTRSMTALEHLILLVEGSGVGIATATGDIDLTTDTGRMVARILAAVARAEVERKAARQRLANDTRAAEGKPWTGGPRAFGYTADGLGIVDTEAAAFRWAVEAALAGTSLRQVADQLTLTGTPSTRAAHSKNGGWTHGGVRKMLLSPRYVGIRVHKGEEMGPGRWPALIDLDTHQALVRKLTDPRRLLGQLETHNSRKPQNLLSLIAHCDTCGETLIAGKRSSEPRYTCRSKRGCIYPPRAVADRHVTEAVLGLLSTPNFIASLLPADDEAGATAQRQLDRLHRRLQVINDEFADGVYDTDEDEYRRTVRELRVKINAQRKVLDELASAQVFADLAVGTEAVIAQWDGLDLDRKRAIVQRLLEVRVKPTGPRVKFDPEVHMVVRRARRLAVAG